MPQRNLGTRIKKEHVRDAQKTDSNSSGISQHMKTSGHNIQSSRILMQAHTQIDRNVKEAIQIIKRNPGLNLDTGNLDSSWQRCFKRFVTK